jgi:hypothetical protein
MVDIPYLQYDPLKIFYNSKTPVGLYARKNWLHQEDTRIWKNDFREMVDTLYSGQRANGSWSNALITTVHKLFGLHLTARHNNKQIEKALEWLISQELFLGAEKRSSLQLEKISVRELQNLPFLYGCFEHFAKCAILFLAAIFGQENDARVSRVYEMFHIMGEQRGGK